MKNKKLIIILGVILFAVNYNFNFIEIKIKDDIKNEVKAESKNNDNKDEIYINEMFKKFLNVNLEVELNIILISLILIY